MAGRAPVVLVPMGQPLRADPVDIGTVEVRRPEHRGCSSALHVEGPDHAGEVDLRAIRSPRRNHIVEARGLAPEIEDSFTGAVDADHHDVHGVASLAVEDDQRAVGRDVGVDIRHIGRRCGEFARFGAVGACRHEVDAALDGPAPDDPSGGVGAGDAFPARGGGGNGAVEFRHGRRHGRRRGRCRERGEREDEGGPGRRGGCDGADGHG